MRIRPLFPKSASILGLVEQAFWRMPFFTEWMVQVPLRESLQGNRNILPGTFCPLGLLVLDAFLSFCRVEELGERFGCVVFARLLISWRKLQLSPLEHCPLAFHCQQSPRVLCSRCFVPWFLTTAFVSWSPFLASKFLIRSFCSILLFTVVSNLW